MAIWEKATLADPPVPNSRVDVSEAGISWVRILSPSHRKNDGSDFTYLGFGNQVIQGIAE